MRRFAAQRKEWSWRQIKIVHALVSAALADSASIDPEKVLDEITDVACLDAVEPAMNEQLAAWEATCLQHRSD